MNKKKKEEIYLFKRFLVRNAVYGLYQSCLERESNNFKENYYFNSVKDFIQKFEGNDFISYAFDWSKTEKGHCFWENLDRKWREELRFHIYVNS